MVSDSEKTERIAWVCVLVAFLGFLLLLFKIEAFSSCSNSEGGKCHDQFYEMNGSSYHTCPAGARAELITSPPAPKAGVLCHCLENGPSAPMPDASK